ncbi:MAG: leucine-rich repeat domain-containing protein [Planctomycetota bacterium]|jgi:hypothetical protein
MRNKKRIPETLSFNAPSLSIVLAILLIVLSSMALAEISGDYEYTNNGDGTCTIINYLGTGGDVTIPDTLNGLTVTIIGDRAFYSHTGLKSIFVPDSVITIGEEAFSSSRYITTVTIGSSVNAIGISAFSNCDALTSIAIPESVTTIGDEAFYSCDQLSSATISDSVTTIGDKTFYYCAKLTSVNIGSGVTTIGSQAFSYCDILTDIMVDPANSAYSSVDGLLFNKSQTELIQCPGGKTGTYSIPNGVI